MKLGTSILLGLAFLGLSTGVLALQQSRSSPVAGAITIRATNRPSSPLPACITPASAVTAHTPPFAGITAPVDGRKIIPRRPPVRRRPGPPYARRRPGDRRGSGSRQRRYFQLAFCLRRERRHLGFHRRPSQAPARIPSAGRFSDGRQFSRRSGLGELHAGHAPDSAQCH